MGPLLCPVAERFVGCHLRGKRGKQIENRYVATSQKSLNQMYELELM